LVSQGVLAALLQVFEGMVVLQESVASSHRFNVQATPSSQETGVPAPQQESTHRTPVGQPVFEVHALYGGLVTDELHTLPLHSDSCDTQTAPGQSLTVEQFFVAQVPPGQFVFVVQAKPLLVPP
jgi:hypothetical protein